MKHFLIVTQLFLLLGCTKESNSLKLEITNNYLVSYSDKSDKDTINHLQFKVTNLSNDIYYFNNIIESPPYNIGLYQKGKVLQIFEKNGTEIKYKDIFPKKFEDSTEFCSIWEFQQWRMEQKRLGYKKHTSYAYARGGVTNFLIHPNESIYFEYYLNISDTIPEDHFRLRFADLKKGKSYYAKLSLASDTVGLNKNLPNDILKTLRSNDVRIFKGILTSSNTVPIKIIE